MAPNSNTELHHFDKGHAWAKLEGLGGLFVSTANPTQTKSGGGIFGHMAQFARILCLEMWNSCLRLRLISRPIGGFHTVHS
jgi:hypothetical protein